MVSILDRWLSDILVAPLCCLAIRFMQQQFLSPFSGQLADRLVLDSVVKQFFLKSRVYFINHSRLKLWTWRICRVLFWALPLCAAARAGTRATTRTRRLLARWRRRLISFWLFPPLSKYTCTFQFILPSQLILLSFQQLMLQARQRLKRHIIKLLCHLSRSQFQYHNVQDEGWVVYFFVLAMVLYGIRVDFFKRGGSPPRVSQGGA